MSGIYSGTTQEQKEQYARLHLAALDAGIAVLTGWTYADGGRRQIRCEYTAALTGALHTPPERP